MTDFRPLRDYSRSRAVLIGVSDYSHLPPVPPARNSLKRMEDLLLGPLCGWPKQRVTTLLNARARDRLPDRLMAAYGDLADVALFYFVGHGQLHEDELCLALRESPQTGGRRTTVGLRFSDVRAALHECDAQTKILILDCCFAGRATQAGHSLATASTNVIDWTHATGVLTLAASGAYKTAWFEADPGTVKPQTYFTKYLIDVIEEGLTGYPEGLPLSAVYDQAAAALVRDNKPEPTRSFRHEAGRFILARNVKGLQDTSAAPQTPTLASAAQINNPGSAAPASRSGPSRRSIVWGSIAAATGGASTLALVAQHSLGRATPRPPANSPGQSQRRVTSQGPSTNQQPAFTLTQDAGVESVAFSPDGRTLASGSDDYTLRLWNIANRTNFALNTQGEVTSVAFSPDGRTVASGEGEVGNIRLWDIATQANTVTFTPGSFVGQVAFSPDGKMLASAAQDPNDNTVRLWDIASRSIAARLHGVSEWVAFSPDGTTLASYGAFGITFYYLPTLAATTVFPNASGPGLAFSPNGRTLATASSVLGDYTVRLWDVASRANTAILRGHAEAVMSLAFSPDGRMLASGSFDTTVRLWDVEARSIIAILNGQSGMVRSVAFSPDGKFVANASDGNAIHVWAVP